VLPRLWFRRGPSRWTPSQAAAFRAICNQRAVPVWGPPGTGKTHFLTTAILALAEAHRRAGRPFRVLVTAFTHAAIENVLRKTVRVDARSRRRIAGGGGQSQSVAQASTAVESR
jgi:superfamily I DNA/RNA helicase